MPLRYPPSCLYTDMVSFLNPAVSDRVTRTYQTLSRDKLIEWVTSGSLCTAAADCERHCCSGVKCIARRAIVHVAGTPCVDWSAQWAKRLRECGPSMLATLVWLAQRLLVAEPLLVHENVKGFDVGLLVAALGNSYIIFSHVSNFADLGFAVTRVRRLTICVRKYLYLKVTFSWSDFVNSCRRVTRYSWHDFLRASPEEIEESVRWAENRKESMARLDLDALRVAIAEECDGHTDADVDRVLAVALETRHTRSLIPSECRRLLKCRDMCMAKRGTLEHLVCYVGQEPGAHNQMSFAEVMLTIVRSGSICWADGNVRRALTAKELLSCQGFISYPSLATGPMTSDFLRPRLRNRRQLLLQAGNSMPVPLVGLALMYSIIAVERRPLIQLSSGMSTVLSLKRK